MASMKAFPLLVLAGILFLTGCTHTRQLGTHQEAEATFDQANLSLEGRRVDIKLRDGRTMASTALRIGPDTTWSIDLLNRKLREAPSGEISDITYTRYGRGAVEGAMLGAAGGALVGLAAGLALTSIRDQDEARTSLGYYVAVPAVFFTILGIGTGTMYGINKGSRDRYVYPDLGEYTASSVLPSPTAGEELPAQANNGPPLRKHN